MTPEQQKWIEMWAASVALSGVTLAKLMNFEGWFDFQIELVKNPAKKYNLAEDLERNDERLGE